MSMYLDRTQDSALAVVAKKQQEKLVELIRGMTDNEEPPETLDQIETMLKAGVNASVPDCNLSLYYACKNYISPVHYAARKGLDKVMDLLLEYGANPNAVDRYDITAVHVAAHSGSTQCLKMLLVKGAMANCETLVIPVHVRREPRQKERDSESEDEAGITEDDFLDIMYANTSNYSMDHLPYNYVGKTTPLHLAARKNRAECIRILMDHGADYNAVDENGDTPLFIAASRGLPDCLMMLLKQARGVPILSIPSKDGSTPLHECCFYRGEKMNDCIKELVRQRSDIGAHNKEGDSPVLIALKQQCDTDVIKFMLMHGYGNDFDPSEQEMSDCGTKKARIQPCLLKLAVNGKAARTPTKTSDMPNNNNNNQARRMIIDRDEDLAVFYISMGMYRSLHREVMVRELRRDDASDIIVRAVKDTCAYLPRLSGVELFGSDLDYEASVLRSYTERNTSSVGRDQSRDIPPQMMTDAVEGIRGHLHSFFLNVDPLESSATSFHENLCSLGSPFTVLTRTLLSELIRRAAEDIDSIDLEVAYEDHLNRVEDLLQLWFPGESTEDWYSEPNSVENSTLSASGRKKKDYLQQRYQLPSLCHLSRCSIRNALQDKVGQVVTFPLPKQIKEYILLGQKLPEGT